MIDTIIMFLRRNTKKKGGVDYDCWTLVESVRTARGPRQRMLLPTRDKTLRLRMAATPSRELKVLLQRMKILIPNRPKTIENVVEKMA